MLANNIDSLETGVLVLVPWLKSSWISSTFAVCTSPCDFSWTLLFAPIVV